MSQPGALHAYYYGIKRTRGLVSITVDHININHGFTVPRATGWFDNDTTITSAWVISKNVQNDPRPPKFYVLCSQLHFDLPPKDMGTCELLIFRKSVYKGGLVNMRSSDLTHIADVLDWFVFIAENKRPHLTQGNSFFAD
jgi:hypothetical protein